MSELKNLSSEVIKNIDEKRNEIIDFLKSLVSMPSVSGSEGEAQEFIGNALAELSISVDKFEPTYYDLKAHPAYSTLEQDESYEGRPNVVGTLRGSGGGRSLILNAHVDTIPLGDIDRWKMHPLSAEIEDGKLYGRGSCDMKGALASMIMAVKCLIDSGIKLRGDVVIQSVVAEESSGGGGTLACILGGYKADAVVVGEPTSLEIQPAEMGVMWGTITVCGKPAHPSWRYEGVSALEKSIKIHDALVEFERERLRSLHHPIADRRHSLPPCFLNIGVLNAGEWHSKVPETGTIKFRVGIMPGEDYRSVRDDISRVVAVLALRDDWMKDHPPRIDWRALWEPTEIDASHPLVSTLQEVCREVTEREAALGIMPGASDLRLLTIYAGIPGLVFGPGDLKMAHQIDEYISVEEVITATKIYALMLLKWCGT